MGRFNPDGFLRIVQGSSFHLSFAGGEANVAVALSNFGQRSSFVTKLPDNDLGVAAMRELRRYGVDVSDIVMGGDRLGLYFVEKGASQRASKVIYDRKHSAVTESVPDDFDWDRIFKDAAWFHFTGITPALSDGLAEIVKDALKAAKAKGLTVSCDINYRAKLWPEQKAGRVMRDLMPYVDVCISNEEDAEKVFGIRASQSDVSKGQISENGYRSVARRLAECFGFNTVAITLRGSLSASDNEWAGILYAGENFFVSPKYTVHLVDRVGGGDSFGGALIYGMINGFPAQKAIDFAVAASCLKQTIEYDFNQVTTDEVWKLVNGDASGRVNR
jgi:2-dehydro-3-deoxygluconokinase